MVKVLVTGFKHSGTTMMMNLLNTHPQVAMIENEKAYIEYNKSKQWVAMMIGKNSPDMKKYICGEKLPWGIRENDLKAKRAIDFSYKWLTYFGSDARILCMVRHPIDVALSRFPLMQLKNNDRQDVTMYHYFINSMPVYLSWARSKKQCGVVVYEELLKYPSVYLSRIFHFLKIQNDKKTIAKVLERCPIDKSRAYAFIKKGVEDLYDYKRLIEQAGDSKL